MGSQGPQCHGGCQKIPFSIVFGLLLPNLLLCQKQLVLRHRCIVYTSMWQVSSGLKEDERGSQGPQCHGGVKNSIFESFRFPAPKLALVPESR